MNKNTNQPKKKFRMSSVIRYSIGIFFIMLMLCGVLTGDILSGVLFGIFGVTLLPVFYDKILYDKFKIKQNRYLPIIIPVVAFLFMCFCMPTDTESATTLDESTNSSISNENVIKEDINIYQENVTEKNEDTTLNETKESTQEIDSSTTKSEEPKQEATTSTTPKVEETKQETTTPTTPKVEEPKQETTTPTTPKVEEPKQEVTAPTTSQPTQNTNNSRGVYRTPHGKRYHFDAECGGENSYSINLDSAISSGLTPCQKCAQ